MPSLILLPLVASLLPLLGADGAAQAIAQQDPRPSRALNITVEAMICGGKDKACGSLRESGPFTDVESAKRFFVRYFLLQNNSFGSCTRHPINGGITEEAAEKWKKDNCARGLYWNECIYS